MRALKTFLLQVHRSLPPASPRPHSAFLSASQARNFSSGAPSARRLLHAPMTRLGELGPRGQSRGSLETGRCVAGIHACTCHAHARRLCECP